MGRRSFLFLGRRDEQMMWRVQMHDDTEAFAKLVQRWELPVQRLCARMLGDLHRGEDLAQEAFSRVFARRKEYQPKARFSTFLWRISLNLCYDELRRLKRRAETSLEDGSATFAVLTPLHSDEPSPDAQLEAVERAESVRVALHKLPDLYQTVLVLRHYQNLKFREIAEVLEIPEGTVKSRMAEGLAQLATILRDSQAERDNPHSCRPISNL